MSLRKVALATASAALALGSLSACSGASNTITPGPAETPTASSSAPAPTPEAQVVTSEPTTEAPAPEQKLSGAFGDTVTFPSGVSVKVLQPVARKADSYAYGAIEGKIVDLTLTVTNKGKEPVNAALMGYPRLRYGAQGTEAQNANDSQTKNNSLTTILSGETQTLELGYGVPSAGFKDVRVEVQGPTYTDTPAIFKGSVK